MTAPAPILLPRADVRPPARDTAPPAANARSEQGKPSGFAAYLAQEAHPAKESPRPAIIRPAKAADANDLADAADAALPPEEPGKDLPVTRQKLAVPVAAFRLLIGTEGLAEGKELSATPSDRQDADPATETPADTQSLTVPLPLAALLPSAIPAVSADPQAAPSGRAALAADGASPTAPRAGETGLNTALPATPPAPPPAAVAAASFVLERDASAFAAEPTQPDAKTAPQAWTPKGEAVARAQPSTLAVLTGAPERPSSAKPRAKGDAALPAAKSAIAPDTASALPLAQPAATPSPVGAADAPTASAPQPLSFDQLVDSIARARDGVDQGGPVAVALRHGEFGRISLRIESDATGLSVAMTSPDPAFAPAVAAAHAAAAAEPARAPAADQRADTTGQNPTLGQSGSNPGAGSGQQRQSTASQRVAANPARSPAPRTERSGGIFA